MCFVSMLHLDLFRRGLLHQIDDKKKLVSEAKKEYKKAKKEGG